MTTRKASARRRYDNRNRVAQAGEIRRRVIEAAARLFAGDGYAATTIQALADEAGVAVQTVYAAFGTKRQVLKDLFDTSVAGDTNEVALVERPEWRSWEDETDPDRRIEAFARAQRLICERAAHIHQILHAAAAADPEIADLYRGAEQARYTDQRRLPAALERDGHLREGLRLERAADITWTLAGPGLYIDLVHARRWRPDEYESWLTDQLRFALAGPRVRRRP
jgi:TetR/AcrR family transcriptional regulator, regulator of autoinduction and epiphytic fitness